MIHNQMKLREDEEAAGRILVLNTIEDRVQKGRYKAEKQHKELVAKLSDRNNSVTQQSTLFFKQQTLSREQSLEEFDRQLRMTQKKLRQEYKEILKEAEIYNS